MTTKERYDKYVEEHCCRCKNKLKYDCEIRVVYQGDIILTKCANYENEVSK